MVLLIVFFFDFYLFICFTMPRSPGLRTSLHAKGINVPKPIYRSAATAHNTMCNVMCKHPRKKAGHTP